MEVDKKIKILLSMIRDDIERLSKWSIDKPDSLVDLEIDSQTLAENAVRLRVLIETCKKDSAL